MGSAGGFRDLGPETPFAVFITGYECSSFIIAVQWTFDTLKSILKT